MKKQQKQSEQVIDLDSFDDEISLWKLVPCGRVGHSMLRTIIDSVHYNAQFSSLLIAGSDGLTTTATCFLKALGCTAISGIGIILGGLNRRSRRKKGAFQVCPLLSPFPEGRKHIIITL